MCESSPQPIEYWINSSIDPYSEEEKRREAILQVINGINTDLDGAMITLRLLGHKLQSPIETEALNALNLIDDCVRQCGARFHNELAKFKFLNQLVRILSPKYSGGETSDTVKQRAILLIYRWQRSLRHLNKLKQVYEMLREQSVVLNDPLDSPQPILSLPPVSPRLASFEDEDKSRLLADLLKSQDPADLQSANRLIRSMVRSEEEKMERKRQRDDLLEKVERESRMLIELVVQQHPDPSLVQDLHKSLSSSRPSLFRYASAAADGNDQEQEEVLPRVLEMNDLLNKALNDFLFYSTNSMLSDVRLLGEDIDDTFNSATDDILLLSSSPDQYRQSSSSNNKSALEELSAIFDATPSSKQSKAPTNGTMTSMERPMERTMTSPIDIDLLRLRISPSRPGQVLLDDGLVRLMLFFSDQSTGLSKGQNVLLLSLSTTSSSPISNIRLGILSRTETVNIQLLPPNKVDLPAFNPLVAQDSVTSILIISTDLTKVDLEFRLFFWLHCEESRQGLFSVYLG